MCGGCVKTEYPVRGNTCLENGSYLMNYVGCNQCKKRDFVMITNRATEEDDGEEIITYDHVCKDCHHVIAKHEYTFSVVDDYQLPDNAVTLPRSYSWTAAGPGEANLPLHLSSNVTPVLKNGPYF